MGTTNKTELLNKGLSDVQTLRSTLETLKPARETQSSQGNTLTFSKLGETLRPFSSKMRLSADLLGYPPINDLAQQFDLLLSLEGIRAKLGYRTPDRTAQLFPFLISLCNRLELTYAAVAANPKVLAMEEGIEIEDRKRRVLIVDDSKTFRLLMERVISSHPRMQVVGVAESAAEAHKLAEKLYPDVITLDIHMPEVDGFTFLREIMKKTPLPVVLVSSITVSADASVFDALYQGAIDFIPKSRVTQADADIDFVSDHIYRASQASLNSLMRFFMDAPTALEPPVLDQEKIIGIGCSTGSTRTLVDILRQLPPKIPPVLVAQQIVPGFSRVLVRQLHEVYPFTVKEAEDGEQIVPEKVYVAPEGVNMSVLPSNAGPRIHLSQGDAARTKPSVDVLFDSLAILYGSKTVGVLLPGSTTDGAQGLLEIRNSNGYTIVQDEIDSPNPILTREAVKIEAAQIVTWGDKVGEVLIDSLSTGTASGELPQTAIFDIETQESTRVLIVDDSPTIRALVRYNLRGMGLSNFGEAKDGLSAWSMLTESLKQGPPYTLVICDQNMPKMKGLEVLQKIRNHEQLKTLPFILITAASQHDLVVEAIQTGISDFVTKPVSIKALAEKVQKVIIRASYGI